MYPEAVALVPMRRARHPKPTALPAAAEAKIEAGRRIDRAIRAQLRESDDRFAADLERAFARRGTS